MWWGNALVCRSRCTRTHNASSIERGFFCPQICKVACFLLTSGGISLRGAAADDTSHHRWAVSVTAVAAQFLLEPSREDKNTHPPRADKILERTRRSRRSPPGEDTTKPSWRWLNLARRCHRLFHSTDPSRLCLGDGQKESAFKGIFHVKSVNFIM